MRWFVFLLIIGTFLVQGQERAFPLVADGFYGVDDFNAIYYQRNNVLYKKSADGIKQFYDVQLGELTTVDLINPLKVLLFYKDTQTVILLDNRLNERQRIKLSELTPYRYFEHVRLAGERRLWLHDLDQNRIELFNYISNEVIVRTPVLKIKIDNLFTDYNFCHVVGGGKVLSFNSYGSRTSMMELPVDCQFISFDFDELMAKHGAGWQLFKFGEEYRFRESETTTKIPVEMSINSLYLKAGKLYIWDGKQVAVYATNPQKK
jgi:hypothetical protein